MADIAMCKGDDCPDKLMCYRYTALPERTYQDYIETAYKNGYCEFFWREKKD